MVLTMHSTMSGMFDQADELSQDASAMGEDFDAARPTTCFYLHARGLLPTRTSSGSKKLFLWPDGKAAQLHHLAQG